MTGTLLSSGAINSATGTLNVNFTGNSGGTATYALTVPVSGNTFNLVGTATQSNVYGFVGTGVITSPLGCLLSCSGGLAGGSDGAGRRRRDGKHTRRYRLRFQLAARQSHRDDRVQVTLI